MASYDQHIDQAEKNLAFLIETNGRNATNWDWQVTVAFYVAVHYINAHLAASANWHFRSHEEVKHSISHLNTASPAKLPKEIYLAYTKLEGLSRRARYLCYEDKNNHATNAFFTHDVHFAKAIKQLDKIIVHFKAAFHLNLQRVEISCPSLDHNSPLSFFKAKKK